MKRIFIFALLSITSCGSFLDEQTFTTINAEEYYRDDSEVEGALAGVYHKLQDGSYMDVSMFAFSDMPTDMMDTRWSNNIKDDFSSSTNSGDENFWAAAWDLNNGCNYLIANSQRTTGDMEKIRMCVAEAYFIRALNYFYLARMYGHVPIITTPTITINGDLQPKTEHRDRVYEQILDDLNYAIENISPTPLQVGRAGLGAAKTLLAKVYLTMAGWHKTYEDPNVIAKGDPKYYEMALLLLNEIIASEEYDLFENYADMFRCETENGIENIFSVQYVQGIPSLGSVKGEGSSKQAASAPKGAGITVAGWESFYANPEFYKQFTDEDKRRDVIFMTSYLDSNKVLQIYNPLGGGTRSHPIINKYMRDVCQGGVGSFIYTSGSDGGENSIILRYADVLLMHSEAQYFHTKTIDDDALWGINEVRERAGLSALDPALIADEEQFVATLIKERNMELCYEYHGWFDYSRLGIMGDISTQLSSKGDDKITKFYYWSIPSSDIRRNPNLLKPLGWE